MTKNLELILKAGSGAFAGVSGRHTVTGKSEITITHESGAKGMALGLVADEVHINNEKVNVIAKG